MHASLFDVLHHRGDIAKCSVGERVDIEFDRILEQPGQPTVSQHYQVHYPMLQNTVLVGTAPPTTTTTVAKPGSTTTTRPVSKATTTTVHSG